MQIGVRRLHDPAIFIRRVRRDARFCFIEKDTDAVSCWAAGFSRILPMDMHQLKKLRIAVRLLSIVFL